MEKIILLISILLIVIFVSGCTQSEITGGAVSNPVQAVEPEDNQTVPVEDSQVPELNNTVEPVVQRKNCRELEGYLCESGYDCPSELLDSSDSYCCPSTCIKTAPKSDAVKADVYVMPYCPDGIQFLKAYVPVMELLKDKADLQVKFVYYTMYGEESVNESAREYCIQKDQNEKFIDYLKCFLRLGDYRNCLSGAKINMTELDNCMFITNNEYAIRAGFEDQALWQNGYPAVGIHSGHNELYNVSISPTFIVNGKTMSPERSAEKIRQVVCSGFNTPPEECNQQLNTFVEDTGFGVLGSYIPGL